MTYRAEDWKPGDVAMIPFSRGGVRAMYTGDGWVTCDRTPVRAVTDYVNMRRLVVIDPEDREQVERLIHLYRMQSGSLRDADAYANALREFATPTPPKPYTESGSAVAPWPVVDECHSSHVAGHECPQCAWEHAHKWVAWLGVQGSRGVPVRCTKCGGRKCDTDECALRRHHKGVHHEATS